MHSIRAKITAVAIAAILTSMLVLFELLVAALVILAVFIVLSFLTMDAATKPLAQLTTAARKLIAGSYDIELDYDGKDEVGTLTAAFRQLRDHLQLYISDLNSRAYSDSITGVRNKGAFTISLARLNDEIRLREERGSVEFAIIILDCNSLKKINDEYGHSRGDMYLQTACRTICQVFAHSPVFRLGGDEFGAILQQAEYRNHYDLLCAFDRAAEETNLSAEQPWERVNLSKGMAEYAADESAEQVLQRADALMYEDKRFYKQSQR